MKISCSVVVLVTLALLPARAQDVDEVDPPVRAARESAPVPTPAPAPPSWPTSFRIPTPQPLFAGFVGDTRLQQYLDRGEVRPTALVSADFDEDGVADLVCGYTGSHTQLLVIHRGNVDAIYPDSPGANRRRRDGTFSIQPFLSPASVFALPAPPDFLAAGDFDNDGHGDVVAATLGRRELHLLSGDGHGDLAAARPIVLGGAVTTMAHGEINRPDGLVDLIVGVENLSGSAVLVFEGPGGALERDPEVLSVPDVPTALALGRLEGDPLYDLAVASKGRLQIVRGRDRHLTEGLSRQASVQSPHVTEVARFESPIRSIEVGEYLVDGSGRRELALLSEDGAMRLLARVAAMGAGDSWREIAKRHVVASDGTGSRLATAKVTGLRGDELVVLDRHNSRLHLMLGDGTWDATRVPTKALGRALTKSLDGEPLAVLPMRLNRDALSDLVVLYAGATQPRILLSAPAAVITVDSALDPAEANGLCELREAVDNANQNGTVHADCPGGSGADLIAFAIPPVGATATIPLQEHLLFTGSGDTIDGTTQGCATPPCIEVTDQLALSSADAVTIRGLVINDAYDGLSLFASNDGIIEGNFIGTDLTGTEAQPPGGIYMVNSSRNTIGGTATPARNVISGNFGSGIKSDATSSSSQAEENRIEGNFIGTDVSGTLALGNEQNGVALNGIQNVIGGTTPGAGNVISSNGQSGVILGSFPPAAVSTLVQGNRIGTDVTGTVALGNGVTGIAVLQTGSNATTVGGTASGAGNVVSASGISGILVYSDSLGAAGPSETLIQQNLVGTDASGLAPMGNQGEGVIIVDSRFNTVGGVVPGAGNLVAAGGRSGVVIAGLGGAGLGDSNTVQGNLIGVDSSGSVGLGNTYSGIIIQDSSFNVVGGSASDARNVISANGWHGVFIHASNYSPGATTENTVQGNFIGTDLTGSVALGNGLDGVAVEDAQGNILGGPVAGLGNLVSGNLESGVSISSPDTGDGAQDNVIQGNLIGTDALGTQPVPNNDAGVSLDGASRTMVGGLGIGDANTIGFNGGTGVRITQGLATEAIGNEVLGNSIHGNGGPGIDLGDDHVTPNDFMDHDLGPNNLQNAPYIAVALTDGSGTVIEGWVESRPLTTYRVEFFSSSSCELTGHREGRSFLGATDVTTDELGIAGFSVPALPPLAVDETITATATAWEGSSEFSPCVATVDCWPELFEQQVRASDVNTLFWDTPSDLWVVHGPLDGVPTYSTIGDPLELLGATAVDLSSDNPPSETGIYYLFRPSECGSWQTALGRQPSRDNVLP